MSLKRDKSNFINNISKAMKITNEKLSELELRIKIEISGDDYRERLTKQLKNYQQKATVKGFRKGMAPMGLIERLYKESLKAEEVQNLLNENLYKYIDDEKMDIMGMPLANEEMTATPDFAHESDFTFYFDAALMPAVAIDWSTLDVKLTQVKVGAKEIDKHIEYLTQQYGKFETPETLGEGDTVYGRVEELDTSGEVKSDGFQSFASFKVAKVKDEAIRALFIGKKADDTIDFNLGKAFTATEMEHVFRMDAAEAKKLKCNVRMKISGTSHISPHPIDQELFDRVFAGQGISSEEQFRKAIAKQIETANGEQSKILFVNQVHKALLDQFHADIPERFLKRWILSRDKEQKLTAAELDAQWAERYLPGIKWELIENELNKIEPLTPKHDEVLAAIKEIIGHNATPAADESPEAFDERMTQAAESIARDENNTRPIVDRIYQDKLFDLLKKQIQPEVEKITAKEFEERARG